MKIAAAEGEDEASTSSAGEEVPPVPAPAPQPNSPAGGATALPPQSDAVQRRVTIVGGPESQWKAQYLIFEKLREEGFANGIEDVQLTVEILVPSCQVTSPSKNSIIRFKFALICELKNS